MRIVSGQFWNRNEKFKIFLCNLLRETLGDEIDPSKCPETVLVSDYHLNFSVSDLQ